MHHLWQSFGVLYNKNTIVSKQPFENYILDI